MNRLTLINPKTNHHRPQNGKQKDLLTCQRIISGHFGTFSFQVFSKPRSSVESRFGFLDRDFDYRYITSFMTG